VDYLETLNLSAADRQKLFYDNARRVLGLRDVRAASGRVA